MEGDRRTAATAPIGISAVGRANLSRNRRFASGFRWIKRPLESVDELLAPKRKRENGQPLAIGCLPLGEEVGGDQNKGKTRLRIMNPIDQIRQFGIDQVHIQDAGVPGLSRERREERGGGGMDRGTGPFADERAPERLPERGVGDPDGDPPTVDSRCHGTP